MFRRTIIQLIMTTHSDLDVRDEMVYIYYTLLLWYLHQISIWRVDSLTMLLPVVVKSRTCLNVSDPQDRNHKSCQKNYSPKSRPWSPAAIVNPQMPHGESHSTSGQWTATFDTRCDIFSRKWNVYTIDVAFLWLKWYTPHDPQDNIFFYWTITVKILF